MMNKADAAVSSVKVKKKAVITILIAVLIIAAVAVIQLRSGLTNRSGSSSSMLSIPFDYNLTVCPSNGSLHQGGTAITEVNVTYVKGVGEIVTLGAYGGPEGATYTFSNQTINLTSDRSLTSNLSIGIPSSAATGTYLVNVTATAENGKTYIASYTLTVLNLGIQVSGNITDNSNNQDWPTQIQFLPQTETYNVSSFTTSVHLDFTHYSGIVNHGTYSIALPNQENYTVIITWNGWPPNEMGPFPNPADIQSGTVIYGDITVHCSIGVTSITQDFTI
jgi:hypothetical protein